MQDELDQGTDLGAVLRADLRDFLRDDHMLLRFDGDCQEGVYILESENTA